MVRARATLLALVLAGCKGDATTPATAPARPLSNASVAAAAPEVPAGWVAIEPDDERLHCANYADDEWQVAVGGGVVRFTEAKPHEADTGPALPFTPKQRAEVRGRRHVLAVSDGFLVGFDAGEWGGSLWWFSKDGTQEQKLADENVHGLVALGPDLVASVEGLSHLSMSDGNLRWIEHAGAWHTAGSTALDAGPSTYAAGPDAIYVLTTKSLVRVGKDRAMTVIQPVRTALMYPDSMAVDATGALWIGMRQFVVRMTPNGGRYDVTWLVRAACTRATVRGLSCVCG